MLFIQYMTSVSQLLGLPIDGFTKSRNPTWHRPDQHLWPDEGSTGHQPKSQQHLGGDR